MPFFSSCPYKCTPGVFLRVHYSFKLASSITEDNLKSSGPPDLQIGITPSGRLLVLFPAPIGRIESMDPIILSTLVNISDIFFSSDISPEEFEYTCDELKKVEYLNAKSIETLLKSLNSYVPSNKNVLFDTRCQITLFAENGISVSIFLNEGRKYLLLDNFLYEASDSLDRLDICE